MGAVNDEQFHVIIATLNVSKKLFPWDDSVLFNFVHFNLRELEAFIPVSDFGYWLNFLKFESLVVCLCCDSDCCVEILFKVLRLDVLNFLYGPLEGGCITGFLNDMRYINSRFTYLHYTLHFVCQSFSLSLYLKPVPN